VLSDPGLPLSEHLAPLATGFLGDLDIPIFDALPPLLQVLYIDLQLLRLHFPSSPLLLVPLLTAQPEVCVALQPLDNVGLYSSVKAPVLLGGLAGSFLTLAGRRRRSRRE
jgi:hypothetical protein